MSVLHKQRCFGAEAKWYRKEAFFSPSAGIVQRRLPVGDRLPIEQLKTGNAPEVWGWLTEISFCATAVMQIVPASSEQRLLR